MLSMMAKAYLVWQVMDQVLRSGRPVRFSRLEEELEDLTAWPSFRDEMRYDSRFLIVGDAVDIATAGAHSSVSVTEVVMQSLNIMRAPMSRQNVDRFVRRIRPDLPAGHAPSLEALRIRRAFEPWAGHLGSRDWFKGTMPMRLHDSTPRSMIDDALVAIRSSEGSVDAAELAAALADRHRIPIAAAYSELRPDRGFVILPGGQVCLYDGVVNEIAGTILAQGNQPDEPVSGDSGGNSADHAILTEDMLQCLIDRIDSTGIPCSTEDVVIRTMGIPPDDPRYVRTFSAVTTALSLAPTLMSIGANRWYLASHVPSEVWVAPRSWISGDTLTRPGADLAHPFTSEHSCAELDATKRQVSFTISDHHLATGIITLRQLMDLLPENPMVQMLSIAGCAETIWYNAEYGCLHGVESWFDLNQADTGDRVSVTVTGGTLILTLTHRASRAVRPKRGSHRTVRQGGRSPVSAIVEALTRAGGSMSGPELQQALLGAGVSLTLADLEVIFDRLPSLRHRDGVFRLAQLDVSVSRSKTAAHLEARELLRTVPPEIASNEVVVRLVRLVTQQPRLDGRAELSHLIGTRRGDLSCRETLVIANLRHALTYLLANPILDDILDDLEDYFQSCAIAVIEAVDYHDSRTDTRVQNLLRWWFIKRAMRDTLLDYLMPVRVTRYAYSRILARLTTGTVADETGDGPDEEPDEDISETDSGDAIAAAEKWLDSQWEPWDSVMDSYEDGGITLDFLSCGTVENLEPVVFTNELKRRLTSLMSTLPSRTADVLWQRAGIGPDGRLTLQAVGERHGITREGARQVELRGMRKLRRVARKYREPLKEFLTDW